MIKRHSVFPKLFSKCIKPFVCVLLVLFFIFTVWNIKMDGSANKVYFPVCFFKQWKETFLTASVCVWGFTLTCAIFLLERLEEVYYGTSLKRIILICFGKFAVFMYVLIYVCLIPLIGITYYWKMWFLNTWLQIVNYAYSAGFVLFILALCYRDTVIELIRDETIRQLKKKDYDWNAYSDEQFAVLNMIRNVDYNDAWQCSRLQSIIVDMVLAAMDENRIYAVYNVVFLLVQHNGYQTQKKRERIVNILSNVCNDIIKAGRWQRNRSDKMVQTILEIIRPLLEVDIKKTQGTWMSGLIGQLPISLQEEIIFGLLFAAEYLYECGVHCKVTVNELLDMYVQCYPFQKILVREKEYIKDCWIYLNIYNRQGVQNEQLCENFIKDYENINTRLCTTKILSDLQMRKLRG